MNNILKICNKLPLPDEIIINILLYDTRYIWRNNELIFIDTFLREDERYYILKKIPRTYRMSKNTWSVILTDTSTKKRFVLGYRNITDNHWEYFFAIYSYDSLLKYLREEPDNTIYTHYYI
jgi:hypothetical protein